MGVSCCVREINKNDDLNNCETISDIRDFLANKLELAELEQEEIEMYLNEKNKLPRTIEVEGLNEEDLKKRILYLNEMKECINKIDDLLKTYIYDDSKRYMKWFSVFQAFTESNKSKN